MARADGAGNLARAATAQARAAGFAAGPVLFAIIALSLAEMHPRAAEVAWRFLPVAAVLASGSGRRRMLTLAGLAAHMAGSAGLVAVGMVQGVLPLAASVAFDALLFVALLPVRGVDGGRILRRWALPSMAVAAVTAALVAFGSARTVAEAALRISAGRPFCIVVGGRGPVAYWPARSFLDLTAFRMMLFAEPEPYQDRFHAVLLVREDERRTAVHNWSYADGTFHLGSGAGIIWPSERACRTRSDFLVALPLW